MSAQPHANASAAAAASFKSASVWQSASVLIFGWTPKANALIELSESI
jgi:hypothetical protein